MTKKDMLTLGAGAFLLVAITAGASAYVLTKDDAAAPKSENVQRVSASTTTNTQAAAPQPRQVACDDDNIVGKVAGGLIGGVAGSQFGSGNGKTAATIGGSVGGTLVGEEYIPTRNVTCR